MNYRHLPLIAGLLIAFSLFLNFFATTNNTWLLKTYPPVDEYRNNLFMQFLLWIALFTAVGSTACLFMRLFEKSLVRATRLCIILCLIQGTMLVVIVLLFAMFNPLKEELEYSEGFFSAIQASCISFLSASFLFFDKITTSEFETKGSGFSRVQRKLLILVSIAILYVTIGTYILMQMEPWSSKESMFFIITTLTTIGFGNRSPKNDHSRLFIIIYSIGGMGILAYTISVISEVLKENVMVSFQTQLTMFREKRYERIVCNNEADKINQNGDAVLNLNDFDDEEEERKIVLNDQKQIAKKQCLFAIVLMILSWAGGACTFYYTEGWTFVEAIYFCFIAFSTIGFGDLVPTTSSSLSIFNIWIILEIATMTFMVSAVTNYIELRWTDSIDSQESNDLEDTLDILRGKKKRKFSFGDKKSVKNESIPMSAISKNKSDNNHRIINNDELDEWEDATESFETILNNTVKINNAIKVLQTNINILKDGYYKNYKKENDTETLPSNSLDKTIERTLKIIEESCKTIKTISIGEDDETEKVGSNITSDEDDNSRKTIYGNEDEQTLIMHSREPTNHQ